MVQVDSRRLFERTNGVDDYSGGWGGGGSGFGVRGEVDKV